MRAEARRKRGPADSWEDRNLAERCLTRGAPKLPGGYNNNFQIWQTPQYVGILQEMIHEVRVIPLDGRPHLSDGVRQWMGDSRGRWEGDTLVVDITNYHDLVMFNSYNCCRGAGRNLHIVVFSTKCCRNAMRPLRCFYQLDMPRCDQPSSGPNLTLRFAWGFPEGLACASLRDARANEHSIEPSRP